MKANCDKSHLIMICTEATTAMIDGFSTSSSKTEVFQGITINQELKYKDNVNYLCQKAGQKLSALPRIEPFFEC